MPIQLLSCANLRSRVLLQTNNEKRPSKLSGYARVIRGLPELVHLERGDFLCDVIDFCCEQNLLLVPSNLKIQEFYASEEYYFHSEEQVSN